MKNKSPLQSNLPRTRVELNALCRSAYSLHPEIHDIINRNALLPVKYLTIKYPKNKKVSAFWKQQFETLKLETLIEDIMREYWTLGEAFVYAELDEAKGMWSAAYIQNPDYVIVKRSTLTSMDVEVMLRPDENLRRIVLSTKPEDMESCRHINQKVIKAIKNGQNIPLESFHISQLIRLISPYEIRGCSFLLPLLPSLAVERKPDISDEIRRALLDTTYVCSDNYVYKELILTKQKQILSGLRQLLNGKIVRPIGKIQQHKEVPEISFDYKRFEKDLYKYQSHT